MRPIFNLFAEKSVYISTTNSSTSAKELKNMNARSHAFFNIVNQSQRKTIIPEKSKNFQYTDRNVYSISVPIQPLTDNMRDLFLKRNVTD
jgi:hypothetical protein